MEEEESVKEALQKRDMYNAQQLNENVHKYQNLSNLGNRPHSNGLNNSLDNGNPSNSLSNSGETNADNGTGKNAVNNILDATSKSGHPALSTISKGVKTADKITGGKVSNKLGKTLDKGLNNAGIKGKIAKKALNSASKKGTSNRIAQASKNKNKNSLFGSMFGSSGMFGRTSSPFETNDIMTETNDKLEDSAPSEGLTNFKIPKKAIVLLAAILSPVFVFVVFLVLMISAVQTFLVANSLKEADSISDKDALDNIDDIFQKEDKLDVEIEDLSYVSDIYVRETEYDLEYYEFATKKDKVVDVESLEAIEELEEFYPDIKQYYKDNVDKSVVYRFFTKLYNVYHYYLGKGVKLDVPLIMSVLNLQSSDTEEVFKLNTVEYDSVAIGKGIDNPDFDINKDWSSYTSTPNNSSHDIEVLAQAMVKEGSTTSSEKDGNYVEGIEFMTGGIGDIYYFNQLDYPSEPYGYYGTIASHGCGPTSLSIVVSSLLKEVHDPVELTNYVCDIGGCTSGGSTWQSITDTPPHYGLQVTRTTNTQEVISALGTGKSLAIAIMCPGHFTSGGHFIVLTGTNSNGQVTVADPASRDRSTDWDFNIVAEENCGAYWIVSK